MWSCAALTIGPANFWSINFCVDAGVVAIYGGAFRRAYGGQVLRVRPRHSPCHECFIDAMPEESADLEISTVTDGRRSCLFGPASGR